MLIVDQLDYPRGYGMGGVLHYLVLQPGMHPLYVAGYHESDYRATQYSITYDSETEVIDCSSYHFERQPIPPRLLAQATERWRQLDATH